MRKAKKLAAAALAVVMALSMSAPAFAAGTDGQDVSSKVNGSDDNTPGKLTVTGTTDKTTGTASTEVKLIYSKDATQLSVEVPIDVTVAVTAEKNFVCPTAEAYKITNKSAVPVHIAEIAVTDVKENYTLDSTTTAVKDLTGKNVRLTMSVGSGSTGETITLNSTGSTAVSGEYKQSITNASAWNIGAVGDTNGNTLGITLAGGVGTIDADWANNAMSLCKIVYTIAAGTAN